MEYKTKPTKFFLKQVKKLSKDIRQKIKDKIKLAKMNPARNKRIYGFNLFLFRIRIKDNNNELRVIYLLDGEFLKILCILDRGNEYKELRKYLKDLGYL